MLHLHVTVINCNDLLKKFKVITIFKINENQNKTFKLKIIMLKALGIKLEGF